MDATTPDVSRHRITVSAAPPPLTDDLMTTFRCPPEVRSVVVGMVAASLEAFEIAKQYEIDHPEQAAQIGGVWATLRRELNAVDGVAASIPAGSSVPISMATAWIGGAMVTAQDLHVRVGRLHERWVAQGRDQPAVDLFGEPVPDPLWAAFQPLWEWHLSRGRGLQGWAEAQERYRRAETMALDCVLGRGKRKNHGRPAYWPTRKESPRGDRRRQVERAADEAKAARLTARTESRTGDGDPP
jgi:hypothetical protein